jgi:hypothetical protein
VHHRDVVTRVRLALGGQPLELHATEPRLTALLAAGLGEELLPAAGGADTVAVTLALRFVPTPPLPLRRLRVWFATAGPSRRLHLERAECGAVLDLVTGAGEAWALPTPDAVRALLRLLLAVLLPRAGGALVHGASLVHQGVAFLFPAASGVGKSTLARATGGDPPLADELSFLAPGATGELRVFPSPFWSGGRPARSITASWRPEHLAGFPLGRILLLEQAAHPWRRRLEPGAAVDRLLAHLVCHARDVWLAGQLLAVAERLSRAVPVERLGVPRDFVLWPWLAEDREPTHG